MTLSLSFAPGGSNYSTEEATAILTAGVTVRLDDGRTIAIVQAADEEFKAGDRVRVLSGGGTTRVAH